MDRLAPVRRNARMYLSRALNRSLAPPDWLSVNLTLQCNLKCVMCTTCYDVPNELGTDEVKGLIDQAALWGVKVFNPLGGELFMRGDLEELLEYACLKDFTITITTNGTLVNKRRAETIARIPPHSLHINISLDGLEAVHDSIRGEGMYRRAMKGLANIREADAAAGNVRRKILANAIVHRRNFQELPDFLDELERVGFDGVQLLNLFRHGEDAPDDHVGMWIRPQDLPRLQTTIDELVRRVETQGRAGFRILNSVDDLRLIPSYYRDELAPLEAPCWAGWKELYINANGDAIMCDGSLDFLAGRFGSARTHSLKQLWASEALRERRQVVKTCSTPCIQNCYLRRDSDSAQAIGRVAVSILKDMARERLSKLRPRRGRRVEGGQLRLELSDTAPSASVWDPASARRFESLVQASPRPVDDCFRDPDLWLEFRDRQYIDFGRGFLGFEVIERVVDDLRTNRLTFPVVNLSWRGEPLLHPEFHRILRFVLDAIREDGVFEELRVVTDGRLLSEDICQIVAAYPEIPQLWVVQTDGLWEDEVEARGRRLAEVRGKATRVVACRVADEDLDPHGFVETWSDILVNAHVSVGALCEAGDAIWFRRAHADHYEAAAQARQRLEELAEVLDVPCDLGPERHDGAATPTVSWDGKVTLCPWDTGLQSKVGQVTDDTLSRIWTQDDNVQRIRSQAEGRAAATCPYCRGVHPPRSPV